MLIPGNEKHIHRYMHGSGIGTYSVGIGPRKYVTRRLTPSMEYITKNSHKIVSSNKDHFNLGSVHTTKKFSQCTMLIYMQEKI